MLQAPKTSVLKALVFLLSLTFMGCEKGFVSQNKTSNVPVNNSLGTQVTCSPTQSQACATATGQGIQYCTESGSPQACVLETCNAGYSLKNGICVENTCTPDTTTACAGSNGTGIKTCNSQGTGFGSCVINKCDYGFHLQGTTCESNVCTSGSKVACTGTNGEGQRVCNADGTGYGTCELSSCHTGYHLQSGSCVADVCTSGTSITCTELNGSGTKTCNSTGTGYGSCQLKSCSTGYNLQNGICVANPCIPGETQSCFESHGRGYKTCSSTGTSFGACRLESCDLGYTLREGYCITEITPTPTPNPVTPGPVSPGPNGACNPPGTAVVEVQTGLPSKVFPRTSYANIVTPTTIYSFAFKTTASTEPYLGVLTATKLSNTIGNKWIVVSDCKGDISTGQKDSGCYSYAPESTEITYLLNRNNYRPERFCNLKPNTQHYANVVSPGPVTTGEAVSCTSPTNCGFSFNAQ